MPEVPIQRNDLSQCQTLKMWNIHLHPHDLLSTLLYPYVHALMLQRRPLMPSLQVDHRKGLIRISIS